MKTAILAAMTLDGKLAHNSSQFVDWTSKEDKRLFYGATKRAGVMVLGSNTFETFPEPLPNRLHVVMTHSTEGKKNTPGLVEYTAASPKDILEDLETRGL